MSIQSPLLTSAGVNFRWRNAGCHDLTYGSPAALGALTLPTSPATAMIVATYGAMFMMGGGSAGLTVGRTSASSRQKPNSNAAVSEPSGVQRPKISAASAI